MSSSSKQVAGLFDPIEPFCTGMLAVTGGHQIYFEVSGNPTGVPVLMVHGGPGGGASPMYRQFFDPKRYRIIMFDQRGCGRSTPHACLEHNTTWHLVADMESLREYFGIKRWVLFGGSWGSTLALAYAETHPQRVRALILRGIFMGTRREYDWLYQGGAGTVFPDFWELFAEHIPARERHDMVAAYFRRVTSKNADVRAAAAKSWSRWEAATSKLHVDPSLIRRFTAGKFADAIARIECHYFVNNCFFNGENQLLRNVGAIQSIPGVIVQGRYDMVCPIVTAHALSKAWPRAQYDVIPDAGHSAGEPGIIAGLVRATNKFADRFYRP